jgi:hypothetical protein
MVPAVDPILRRRRGRVTLLLLDARVLAWPGGASACGRATVAATLVQGGALVRLGGDRGDRTVRHRSNRRFARRRGRDGGDRALETSEEPTNTERSTTTERETTTTEAPTTTTEPPTTTEATTTTPTTAPPPPPPTTAPAPPPPTTAAPAPPPPPPPLPPPNDCHPSYDPCVPIASDVDCEGGSGDGPVYTGTVRVIGPDEYGLDDDGDGVGCEAS